MKLNRFNRLLFPALAVYLSCISAASAWWGYGWERRQIFHLNNDAITTDTDTISILITVHDTAVFNHTQPNGEDIRFVANDDTTRLDHEIELWDTTQAGTAYVWVQVHNISRGTAYGGTADSIYFYYGNPWVSDGQKTEDTWDKDYMAVYHMNEAVADSIRDHSRYGNDETDRQGTSRARGLIGYARDFDAAITDSGGDYIDVGNYDIVSPSNGFTLEAWFSPKSWPEDPECDRQQRLISKANGRATSEHWWMMSVREMPENTCLDAGGETFLRFRVRTDSGGGTGTTAETIADSGDVSDTTGAWFYAVGIYDGADSTIRMYLNGLRVGEDSFEGALLLDSANRQVWIGANPDVGYMGLDGFIDEVRVSNAARSDGWVTAQYQFINNPGSIIKTDEQDPPTIRSAVYHSAGTDGVNGDSLIVTFSFGVVDTSLPAGPDGMFGVLGLGSMTNATLTTGSAANDNIVVVKFTGTDTIFCHNRTRLALYDSVVSGPGGKPCLAGTVDVVTRNVAVLRTGAVYETINEGYAAAVAGDSILVFDAGLYPETLTVLDDMAFMGYGIGPGYDSLPVLLDPQTLTDGWHALVTCSASVVIEGFKMVCLTDSVKAMDFVDYSNSEEHVIRKCVFDGTGTARNCFIDDFWRGKTSIDSCEFTGFTVQCVYFRHDDYALLTGKSITDCYFHDMTGPAIWIRDSRETDITGNTFRNIDNNYGIIRITASFDVEISDNVFDSCSGSSSSYGTVNMDNNAYYYWIKNNTFNDCTTRGGTIVFNGAHFGHTTNNLISGCFRGITTLGASNYTNAFIFNTVARCDSGGISISTRDTDTDTVKYNISWGNGPYDFRRTATMPVADYNFHGNGGLVGWTTGTYSDSGYPQFADTAAGDWRLTAASPCIDFSFVDGAYAAAMDAGTDLDGQTRPMPAGTWADAGCYEEQTSGRMDVVLTDYRAVGTATAADDTMTVWFRHNAAFDSLPQGAGDADLLFGVLGGGGIANATIVLPNGLSDTDFVYVHLNAGDSVLSHNRTDLVTKADFIYAADGFPSRPDTDHVCTWNVRNMRTGTDYPVVDSALMHCIDDDTIMIFDAGYYVDTLNFGVRNVSPYVRGTSSYPSIRYNGTGIGGTQQVLASGNRSVRFDSLRFSGVTLDGADTCSGSFAEMNGGTVENCSLYFATFKFDDGAQSFMRNCDIYGARLEWWTDDGGELSGCAIHGVASNSNALYLYGAENSLIENNRIFDNTVTAVYRRRARNNTIRNNIIYDNAWYGMYGANTPVSRHNRYIGNVFANNGAGLQLDSMSVVRNNIFYNNGQYNVSLRPGCRMPKDSITYNFFDTTDAGMGDSLTGEGNVISTAAPLFADIAGGDFHLRVHSPAIDRGDTAAAWNDYDGGRCDMGAYGGPYAADTLNPHRLDTLAAFSASLQGYASDTVWWDPYTLPDFVFYAVYRDGDGNFVPSEANCIDSIYDIAITGARYTNDGGAYVYKISAVDTADYGGGYQSATYPRIFTAKTTHQTHTVPGDTLVYTVYYDNDGELPTSDTVTFIDYLPVNVTFIDTAGAVPHNGGAVDVDWYTGSWQETEPGVPSSVTAVRWQVPAAIAAHEDGGDVTGADAGKTGIDTTGGDDAGKVYFRVQVK